MTEVYWFFLFAILLTGFLGSELSHYEDVQASFKEIEEREKNRKENK